MDKLAYFGYLNGRFWAFGQTGLLLFFQAILLIEFGRHGQRHGYSQDCYRAPNPTDCISFNNEEDYRNEYDCGHFIEESEGHRLERNNIFLQFADYEFSVDLIDVQNGNEGEFEVHESFAQIAWKFIEQQRAEDQGQDG